jgi:hypothetical protein
VSPNTLIQASWANNTLNDVAAEITNSLARNGAGGMTGPFRATDGSVGTPSISFNSETASGLYRPAAGQISVSIQGVLRATFSATGLSVTGDVSATGAFSGSGANLTNLNASNLASGTVPDARFPSALPAISGANLTNLNASNLASGTVPDARFPSALPAISGANLTNLNASNLASGTVPDARFPATLPAVSGANLTNLNASNLASGTVPSARVAGAYTSITAIGNGGSHVSISVNGNVTINTPSSGTHTINGGFTSGGNILVTNNTGIPNTIISNIAIASGYSSPVAGRILFGDNTGWKLQFGRRNGGSESVIAELVDNGDIFIFNTAGVTYSWHIYQDHVAIGSYSNSYKFSLFQNGNIRLILDTDAKTYVVVDGMTNEIGFRRVPRTTDTTLNTAKVAQCIALTSGVTIPANTYAAGDSFSIYNDSTSSITLTQGSGLTLRQSGTSNTGNRTLAARGMATIWFNSATEAIVMGDVT